MKIKHVLADEIPAYKPRGRYLFSYLGGCWVEVGGWGNMELENIFTREQLTLDEWEFCRLFGESLHLLGWVETGTGTVHISHPENFAPAVEVDMEVWGEVF